MTCIFAINTVLHRACRTAGRSGALARLCRIGALARLCRIGALARLCRIGALARPGRIAVHLCLAATMLPAGAGLAPAAQAATRDSGGAGDISPPGHTITRPLEWHDTFDAALDAHTIGDRSHPILTAQTGAMMKAAIRRYEAIIRAGGWPRIPESTPVLRIGADQPVVAILRERLIASGDLDESAGLSNVYDSYVAAAIRRFQQRHGLRQTGTLNDITRDGLNVSPHTRLKQLQINLERAIPLGRSLARDYVLVNIPGAEVEAVDNRRVHSRHTAVVGKIDRQTPIINSTIHELNFNPYWTVPVSIIARDLIPKVKEDPDYLRRYNIRIFDRHGKEKDFIDIDWTTDEATRYRFRQDPGPVNSLGTVRINFANRHQVYLHDTPSKNLFGTDNRFHSSGCVRVQNIHELTNWMLEKTTRGWNRKKQDLVVRSGARRDVRLGRGLPIYFTYLTAWADHDGIVHFRPDIYNRDGLGAAPVARSDQI